MTSPDNVSLSLPSVDPRPLLDALDAAAAVFDVRGVLRCQNQRWGRLFEESSPPAFPLSSAPGRTTLPASADGLTGASGEIVAGLQALFRGEREELTLSLPRSATGPPGWKLSATPCLVDGARGALVCLRDLPAPPRASKAASKPIEAFFDTILDHLPLAIFIKEAKEFRLIRTNRRYEEYYAVSRGELLGKNNYDTLPKSKADYIYAKDKAVIDSRKLLDIPEERFDLPGSGDTVLHTQKLPLYDEETGEPLYIVCIAEDITAKKHAEEARQRELAWLEAQSRLKAVIQELSTPIIPVHEGILVLPLVGHLDEARCAQMKETLLRGIERHRAEIVLLDITGVALVDAAVAGHLLMATRAAALLGATCILVGASPDVARTMVELGIDLGRLLTQRDLGAGIVHALTCQGKVIVNGQERSSSSKANSAQRFRPNT